VSLPTFLPAILDDPRFWEAYFWLSAPVGGVLPEVLIELPVDDGCALIVDVEPDVYCTDLLLRHPLCEPPALLGSHDGHFWKPHALRWPEVDLFGSRVAGLRPDLVHPGLAVALLCRFAPVCDDRDADLAATLVAGARQALPSLPPTVTDAYLQRADLRGQPAGWRHDPDIGWYAHYEDDSVDLYTIRETGPDGAGEFPFEAFADLVHRADCGNPQ
jgi:hypothetical protein